MRGDLVAFRTPGVFAVLIRFGQRISGVKNWEYNHIGVLVNNDLDPMVIQAVRRDDAVLLSSYIGVKRVYLRFPGSPRQADYVVRFAHSALGRKYGILSVISHAINCLTPKLVSFSHGGDCDCSGLAARAWEHGGVILPEWDTTQIMPGQMVDWYL